MSDSNTKTILVVDDDKYMRDIIKVALGEASDYTFLEAVNGQEACDIVQKVKIDLILLDAIMPIMDGFDACKKIKDDKKFSNLPVIMLTSLCDVDSISRAFSCGAADFLAKPIAFPLLIQRVNLAVQSSVMEQALSSKTTQASPMPKAQEIDTSDKLMWKCDLKTKNMEMSNRLKDILEIERNKQYVLSDFIAYVDKSLAREFKSHLKNTLQHRTSDEMKLIFVNSAGKKIKVSQNVSVHKNPDGKYYLEGILDLDEHTQVQDADYFKYHDQLTELLNQLSLEKTIKEGPSIAAVVYLTVDKMDEINQDHGQAIGNKALQSASQIISDVYAENSLVYRYHGNAFIVLVNNEHDQKSINKTAFKIQETVRSSSIFIEYSEVSITVSVGVAFKSGSNNSIEELISCAGIAAKKSRASGGDTVSLYNERLDEENKQDQGLANSLITSIRNDEMESVYRILSKSSRSSKDNVASLKYWLSPSGQNIDFKELSRLVDVAEIHIDLGKLIIKSVFKELKHMYSNGFTEVKLTLRLTEHQIYSDNIVQCIVDASQSNDIPFAQVCVEICDSLMHRAFERCQSVLNKLKKHGVAISVKNHGRSARGESTNDALPLMIFSVSQSAINDKADFWEYDDLFKTIVTQSDMHEKNKCIGSIDNMLTRFQDSR